jgi:1-acyl-sn-glycerol-3-phosphate acyltransferase
LLAITARRRVVVGLFRFFLRLTCRIDKGEIKKLPAEGPVIVCFNHINFLEAPLLQVLLYPRILIGVAKKESWKSPVMAFIANSLETIPIDRSGVNLAAFDQIRSVMKQGAFLGVSPEGTRSGSGILQEGKPGIIAMALMTKAPIVPVIMYGHEKFWENFKHFRRTPVTVRVGKPFNLVSEKKPRGEIRTEMTQEVMYQMAALLPPHLRGPYGERGEKEILPKYVKYLD